MNQDTVKDIVSGFFQDALGAEGAWDQKRTGLLREESRNDREEEYQQPSDVERHGSLF